MKTFDVHFSITGSYTVEARDPSHAKEVVNDIIADSLDMLEEILVTGLGSPDDDFVTEVIPQ